MKKTPLLILPMFLALLSVLLIVGCSDKIYSVSPLWKTWQNGDTVPGYVLSCPSGSRADVEAKAQMWDNYYALELASYLNTGHDDDHAFVVDQELAFALYISDASDSIWNGQHVIHLVWSDTDYDSPDTVSVYDLAANGRSAPVIDGDGADEAWNVSDGVPETQLEIAGVCGDNGLSEAYIVAVHDSTRIYFKLAWPDPNATVDMVKDMWYFDGQLTWTREGQEDMVVFLFPTEQAPAGWDELGGATYFPAANHPADGSVNVWRWCAGRTNPLGWADDLLATDSELHEDDGTGVFTDNCDPQKSYPPYVQHPAIEPSLGDEVLSASEAIPFEDTIKP
jgi:hypothetical protein